ncbi:MAG: hypothetical protein C4291_15880 [Candidatus Dadabacteria bacterium]
MKVQIAAYQVEWSAFGKGLKPLSAPPTPAEVSALTALFQELAKQGFTPEKVESYRGLGMEEKGRFLLRSIDQAGRPKEFYGRVKRGRALLEDG